MNQQLDELCEPTFDDICLEEQRMSDPAYVAAVEKYYTRRLQRGRVIIAAKQRDVHALDRLTANDPALAKLALRVLTNRRGRGRQKGEARPRDLSPSEKALLEDALRDLDRIREICVERWQRWKGTEPIALEIAAERADLDPEQLRNFKKNRARDLRNNSAS
jgi:hypothetical protein